MCCRNCSWRSRWLLYVQLVNKEDGKDVEINDQVIHCRKQCSNVSRTSPPEKASNATSQEW